MWDDVGVTGPRCGGAGVRNRSEAGGPTAHGGGCDREGPVAAPGGPGAARRPAPALAAGGGGGGSGAAAEGAPGPATVAAAGSTAGADGGVAPSEKSRLGNLDWRARRTASVTCAIDSWESGAGGGGGCSAGCGEGEMALRRICIRMDRFRRAAEAVCLAMLGTAGGAVVARWVVVAIGGVDWSAVERRGGSDGAHALGSRRGSKLWRRSVAGRSLGK